MADLLDLDTNPFDVSARRRRGAGTMASAAIPRTAASPIASTFPSFTNGNAPGGSAESIVGPPTESPVPTSPNYNMLGPYAGTLRGYDLNKFQQPFENWDEKYRIGAVQSWFDPRKGVNDDFLGAIRSLGLAGGVSGGGGNLTFSDPRNGPRVRMGTGGTGDVVFGYDGQNADTAWQPWFVEDGATGSDPASSADPLAALLALLGKSSAPTAPPPPTSAAPDLSWLGPFLASLTNGDRTHTPNTSTVNAPPYAPSASTAQPTFQGGYAETPMAGGGDVSRAMQLLGLNLPSSMTRTTVAPTEDPLVMQLRRLAGVQ